MAENFIHSSSTYASASNPSVEGGQSSSAPAHQNQISIRFYPQQKPRLKWTPQLHARFLEAVQFLGGVQCATPKAILDLMNEKDLTIKQVRSHLQIHRTHCFDQEQLARETQAAVVAQLAWIATVPYQQPWYPYGYPLYSAPPPPLYSPLRPQLPSPPQHLLPPPPPATVMTDYSAPAPKTIIFNKLFPNGRPMPIDAEETPAELMMSGDVNPAGPSSSAARNEGEDDGPLDLTLSIRLPSRHR